MKVYYSVIFENVSFISSELRFTYTQPQCQITKIRNPLWQVHLSWRKKSIIHNYSKLLHKSQWALYLICWYWTRRFERLAYKGFIGHVMTLWIEFELSSSATKTDTICVIGIVNVKVVGSIENGERIYASTDRPGKAIPQSHMPVGSFLRKKHALLGMALETKKSKTLDDAHLVKCFVCIVLDVSRKELQE